MFWLCQLTSCTLNVGWWNTSTNCHKSTHMFQRLICFEMWSQLIAWRYQEMQVYSHMMQCLHMDTNTKSDTTSCIAQLFTYFLDPSQYNKLKHYSPKALIKAINIGMHSNRIKIRDLIVKQLISITMDMSLCSLLSQPLPCHHKSQTILQYIDNCTFILWYFIDDGFGLWLHIIQILQALQAALYTVRNKIWIDRTAGLSVNGAKLGSPCPCHTSITDNAARQSVRFPMTHGLVVLAPSVKHT